MKKQTLPILDQIQNKCIQGFNHHEYHSSGIINGNYPHSPNNPFYNDFNNYLNNLKEINYIILMENPLSYGTYVYNQHGRGSWISAINSAFGITKNADRLEQWLAKGILPLDIFQFFLHNNDMEIVGLNLKDIREFIREAIYENLPYPVYRTFVTFEFLDNFLLLDQNEKKINPNCTLALLMPQVTSLPIFNYFNNPINQNAALIAGGVNFADFIRQSNPLYTPNYINTIRPLHKANAIGGSNIPDANLIRIACSLDN
jgi:hypothetical protein